MPSVSARALLDVVKLSAEFLEKKGVEDARLNAERLVAHALNCDRLALYLEFDRPLSEGELDAIRQLVARRGRREPLQHILGRQPFRELDLKVTAATLVPRPETEEVVEAALAQLDRIAARGIAPTVLDLGTGSGCIALSVARERPGTRVLAVDVSAAALEVARENGLAAGLADVAFFEGDLFAPVTGQGPFHLIVSNPPYLTPEEWDGAAPEVKNFDPEGALVGGADGLALYRRIFAEGRPLLAPGGAVVVEIGMSQGEAVAAIANKESFERVTVARDLAGRDRIVCAILGEDG